ncbi:hypothetical protein AIZ15_24690, partial [Salmonella enterica subsp. enterica serovar Typhimurium]
MIFNRTRTLHIFILEIYFAYASFTLIVRAWLSRFIYLPRQSFFRFEDIFNCIREIVCNVHYILLTWVLIISYRCPLFKRN